MLTAALLLSWSACYFISALCSTLSVATLVASFFFLFNILFGGVLLTARTAAVNALMYGSLFNYGFQMLMMNEFFNMKRVRQVGVLGCWGVGCWVLLLLLLLLLLRLLLLLLLLPALLCCGDPHVM